MKRIKSLILIILCMLFLSGCAMKRNYEMTIDKNGKITLEQIEAYDKELIGNILRYENLEENAEKTYTDEDYVNFINEETEESKEKMISSGYVVDKYRENDFFGLKASMTIDNIENVSTEENIIYDLNSGENLKTSKLFKKEGNKYIANFEIIRSEDELEDEESSIAKYEEALAKISVESKFVVRLPKKPSATNAKDISSDGLTLTWNLLDKNLEKINFEFELPEEKEGFKLTYLIFIGMGLLGIAAAILIVVISKTKSRKKGEQNSEVAKNEFEWMNAVDNHDESAEETCDEAVENDSESVEDNDKTNEYPNKCPYCDSEISAEIDKCPFCNANLR